MALSAQERQLARAVFVSGPAVLEDEGWSTQQIQDFQHNPEVLDIWAHLKREYDIHEGLRARGKFAALRNLHRMIDPASAVLAQALGGPEYVRDARGVIQRDAEGRPMLLTAEVTPTQYKAAEFVLAGAGIRDHRLQGDAASDPSLKLLFASTEDAQIVIEDDPLNVTEEARALSRERVRIVIERLSPRVIEARGVVKKATGIDPATETSTARLQEHRKAKRAAAGKKGPKKRGRKSR